MVAARSEFVSNDRLFRVRSKQPHSCITFKPNVTEDQQLFLPIIKNSVQVGDMCAFKKNKKCWRIGRILQFARPGSKPKSSKSLSKPVFTQQFKGCAADVTEDLGVMCTWYEQMHDSTTKFELSKSHKNEYIPLSLYKCTLPNGCFDNISDVCIDKQYLPFKKAPSATLFTKQCLTMTEACLTCLNVTEGIKKVQNADEDHTVTDDKSIIVLSDSEEQESDYWLKISSIKLYANDRTDILNGTWLNSSHMAAVQSLLKSQFPHFGGLKDPITQLSVKSQISLPPASLQILHVHGNHWITVSTCGTDHADVDIIVYDSKYPFLDTTTETLLSKLVLTQRDILKVHIANVNKQSGDNDCGVFSAAYCTSLTYEQNSSEIVYNQSILRQHLIKCLEEKKMVPFPQIRPRRSGKPIQVTINVYCYCRLPDDGSRMVKCDKCGKWYHLKCIGSNMTYVIRRKWYCKYCTPTSTPTHV